MAGEHFASGRIRSVRDVAEGVREITLVPDNGTETFAPGSHIDVAVTIEGLPDVRSYSLVGEHPDRGAYRIAVKAVEATRGGSRFMHALAPGDPVSLSRPKNHFDVRFGRPEYLLVAGGIGITPLIGMAAALVRQDVSVRLLYAGRTKAELAFVDELTEVLGDRLRVFVSGAGERIDLPAEIATLDPDGELYLCGPLRMREAAQTAWRRAGRRTDRLRFETFASGGRFAAEEFTVCVSDQGDRTITVSRTQTMLEALQAAGIEAMWDCVRGECGLCAVRVLTVEGEIDHRDVFLSDEEHVACDSMMACVSRAVGGGVRIDTGFRA